MCYNESKGNDKLSFNYFILTSTDKMTVFLPQDDSLVIVYILCC